MPDGDSALAQSVYLAQMFAQKGTCNCEACQLLRKATEGMISQFLGGALPGAGTGMAELVKQASAAVNPEVSPSQEVT